MPTYRVTGYAAKHRLEPLLKKRGWEEVSGTPGVDETPIGFVYETTVSRNWKEAHRYMRQINCCVVCVRKWSIDVVILVFTHLLSVSQPL